MKKVLFGALLVLSGCYAAENQTTEKSLSLRIRTVDEAQRAFQVQTVRWWHSGNSNSRHELKCTTGLCSEWVIHDELTGAVVIHADAARVKQDDKNCWDLYSGETVVNMPAQEAVITMTYINTVCS